MSSPSPTPAPASGRRERKRIETLRRIRSAAVELFARSGYDAVTMTDVADRADVSLSTLIRAVPTKQDLLVGLARPAHGEILRAFDLRPRDEDPGRALARVVLDYTAQFESHGEVDLWRDAMAKAPADVRRVPLLSPTEKAGLVEMVARRLGTEDSTLRAGIVVATVLAACEYAFEHWLSSPAGTGIHTTMTRALELALGDLG